MRKTGPVLLLWDRREACEAIFSTLDCQPNSYDIHHVEKRATLPRLGLGSTYVLLLDSATNR